MKVESSSPGGLADGIAGSVGVPRHRHPAGLRIPRDARMAAQLGAADRARHGGKRRPAGHRSDARHARRSLARAGQSRLGRAVARVADRYERPGRDGIRALPVSGIVLQLAARQLARGRVFQSREPLPCVDAAAVRTEPLSGRARHEPARSRRAARQGGRVQRGAGPLCDVRDDARRPSVSDRRAARVHRPVAGDAAFGHRLHGEPGLGPRIVLCGHPRRRSRRSPRAATASISRSSTTPDGWCRGRQGGGASAVAQLPASLPRSVGQHGRARRDSCRSGHGRFRQASRPALRWWAPHRAPTRRCSPPARPP